MERFALRQKCAAWSIQTGSDAAKLAGMSIVTQRFLKHYVTSLTVAAGDWTSVYLVHSFIHVGQRHEGQQYFIFGQLLVVLGNNNIPKKKRKKLGYLHYPLPLRKPFLTCFSTNWKAAISDMTLSCVNIAPFGVPVIVKKKGISIFQYEANESHSTKVS